MVEQDPSTLGGGSAYYYSKAWLFLLHNNPDLKPKPLDTLPRCELFSPKLHAFGAWRSSWKDDATLVFFKFGENVDHHGTWDTGKFTIWKNGPLAIKSGLYDGGYKGMFHHFYKLPYSANCVIFYGDKKLGWQPGMPDLDGYTSWKTWKARRDAKVKHPVTGELVKHEVNDKVAYAVGDLSGATYPTGSKWIREIAFLGYKYVVVLDRVKPGEGTTTKWLLQSIRPAKIEAEKKMVTIDNGKAVLFCKTLLPEKVEFKETGLVEVEKKGKTIKAAYSYPYRNWKQKEVKLRTFPKTWFQGKKEQMNGHGRVEVIPADPAAEQVYLHVLYPVDKGGSMPDCSFKKDGEAYTVTVGGESITLKE